MKARTFNAYLMPQLNQRWVANVLGIQLNDKKGVDLISDDYIMEVKFSLPRENGWTILRHEGTIKRKWEKD